MFLFPFLFQEDPLLSELSDQVHLLDCFMCDNTDVKVGYKIIEVSFNLSVDIDTRRAFSKTWAGSDF